MLSQLIKERTREELALTTGHKHRGDGTTPLFPWAQETTRSIASPFNKPSTKTISIHCST